LVKLLRYLDTPQYLRKRVFPHSPLLKYAGVLPPLRIPSHPLVDTISGLRDGEFRWGVQVDAGEVDIGVEELIAYNGSLSSRDPTLFRLASTRPHLQLEVATRADTRQYFGFEVQTVDDLIEHLQRGSPRTRVALSRNGVPYNRIEKDIIDMTQNTSHVVMIFGDPKRGVRELFSHQVDDLKSVTDFWVSTIDDQGTESVRLEEALIASLAMFCASLGSSITKPGYHA
jgi:predicted SPOUT superfamily RNA methylase MTH1